MSPEIGTPAFDRREPGHDHAATMASISLAYATYIELQFVLAPTWDVGFELKRGANSIELPCIQRRERSLSI